MIGRPRDPVVMRQCRLLLEAAGRRLASLESPSGYAATHYGGLLWREAVQRIREALAALEAAK